jgi:hypothetical protein
LVRLDELKQADTTTPFWKWAACKDESMEQRQKLGRAALPYADGPGSVAQALKRQLLFFDIHDAK